MGIKFFTPTNDDVGINAVIHTAKLPFGTLVKIIDDGAVDLCDSEDDIPIGYVFVAPREADGEGTVQTPYGHWVSAQCKGAVAAGDRVKMGASVAGVQTFKKWTAGADNPDLIIGVCWVGGADTEIGQFLIF